MIDIIMEPETTKELSTYRVEISLSGIEAERIRDSRQDVSNVANYLVQEHAKGGVMLARDKIEYIGTFCNTPLRTSNDIMEVFETAVNRRAYDGSRIVTYRVDPALVMPLEDLARTQGRLVDDIVQDAMNIVFTNSWMYSFEVSGCTIHFTREQREEMEALAGGSVLSGEDVMKLIPANRPYKPSIESTPSQEKRGPGRPSKDWAKS